jgi:hypothetical protein
MMIRVVLSMLSSPIPWAPTIRTPRPSAVKAVLIQAERPSCSVPAQERFPK